MIGIGINNLKNMWNCKIKDYTDAPVNAGLGFLLGSSTLERFLYLFLIA